METKDYVNKRTGLGAAIGGVVGWFLGAGPWGAAIGATVGGALANVTPPSKKGEITPKRKMIYEAAINGVREPEELLALAESFESEGLRPWAEILRARAKLRSLPSEIRDARKDAFRKAMASDSPGEIRALAAVFEKETAFDAAKCLRDHADAVHAAHEAGKSGKPMPDAAVIDQFAEKLGKAIFHYGKDSPQAKSAAANFIHARGMTPDAANVAATIEACAAELDAATQAPSGGAPPDAAAPNPIADAVADAMSSSPAGPTAQPPAAPSP